MLFTVDKESLPEDSAYNRSRDREQDYKMESILNAQNITDIEHEHIDKRKKKGQTTTEENNQCQRHYYKNLLALDEPKPEDLKAFVYGNYPLNNCLGLVDFENHYSEDNLKSVTFRERASAVSKLPYLIMYKHVKEKAQVDKYEFLNNWKHVVQHRTFTAGRMN